MIRTYLIEREEILIRIMNNVLYIIPHTINNGLSYLNSFRNTILRVLIGNIENIIICINI